VASDAGRATGRVPVAIAPASRSAEEVVAAGREAAAAANPVAHPIAAGGYPAVGASNVFSSRMRVPFRLESTTTRSMTACIT
jgi:hypothetical protein